MANERPWSAPIRRVRAPILERVRADGERAPEDVGEILEVLREHLFERDFDLSDVRRACAPSAETLRRFREHLGGSPKSYVTAQRRAAAEELVGDPEVELPEVAAGLGFADAALFSRWFRRWTGETPEARRSARCAGAPAELPDVSLWFQARASALRRGEAARLIRALRRRPGRASPRDSGSS